MTNPSSPNAYRVVAGLPPAEEGAGIVRDTGTLCKSYWHDGRMSGPCQREAKEDGLCAQHLAGRRRSQEASERASRKRAEEVARRESAEDFLRDNGISGSAEYSAITSGYTGRVVLTTEELARVILGEPS